MTGADASVTCFKPIVTQQVAVFDGRSLPKACVRVAGHEGPCRSADDDAFAITPGPEEWARFQAWQEAQK